MDEQNHTLEQEEISEPLTEESSEFPTDDLSESVNEATVIDAVDDKSIAAVNAEDENPSEPVSGLQGTLPYHKRYYLLYGKEEPQEGLDLQGTRQFLNELGFDGGELRQARQGRDYAQTIADAEEKRSTHMTCAYCGAEITGVGYNRLPDGRLRCTTCSSTLVKSRGDLEAIYNRVRLQMETFFGTSFNVPVEIQFLEERKMKKKLRFSIGEVDEKSTLILGVAVNEKKQYKIYLENGAPRMSVIATLVHEMTHIWQYTHWKEKSFVSSLPANSKLLVYEGMAKWAEIQYLYLIGESTVARREEAFTSARTDEYGVGFNLYADQYPISREAMTCIGTPFVTDHCPIE